MLVGDPGDLGLWVEAQGVSPQEKGLPVLEHTRGDARTQEGEGLVLQ